MTEREGQSEEEERRELEEGHTPTAEPAADPMALITRELERVHLDSYGTGAHRIHTHLVGDRFVLCVIDNEVTAAERTLLDAGKGDAVKNTRMAFQEAIESTFVAVVERAVGRRVEAFISHVHIDPMFTVELFRLAPEKGQEEELE